MSKSITPSLSCESCGRIPVLQTEWVFCEDVACQIATYSEQSSDAIRKLCAEHGLIIFKKNKTKYLVIETSYPTAVRFADQSGRCFQDARILLEGDSKAVMAYLFQKTKPIPAHLIPKGK